MVLERDQMEAEILKLKEEVKELSQKGGRLPEDSSASALIKYLVEERERTNRALSSLIEKIGRLEQQLHAQEVHGTEINNSVSAMAELPISNLEGNILNLVKEKGMVCADDLRSFMNYNGRNAACARLSKLHREGFLQKFQLGHRVYYKIDDAGKATNTLIISPPQ
ncbi:MAG: hypothetical protein M1569_00820 [Candidatus Marsarchaeota archaeon]|nr:hypothetical protein [Candidatus Marsarchaeota archaeon]MCL5412930.1 hypothetical protein [Candidatus Marsarchaeota archaeon]